MEKGKIKYSGTYEEIEHSEEIQDILKSLAKTAKKDKEEEKSETNGETLINGEKSKETLKKSFISEKGTSITEDENKEKITVGWKVYISFFVKNYSWLFYLLFIILSMLSSFASVQNGIYTGKFIDPRRKPDDFWRMFMITLLFAIGFAVLITLVGTGISLATVRLTKRLHIDMLKKTANAPVNLYFDKTPSGRILNRYSSDINKLDNGIDQ